jgi:hypothetical protein
MNGVEHSTGQVPSDDAADRALQNNNAMGLLSRRRWRISSHAGGFFSTIKLCGYSWISRNTGHCANNRERDREREKEKEGESNGSGGSPDYDSHSTLTRTRKPSAAVKPSAAEMGGSGVSPDCDTTQHAHAHNKPSALEKRHISDCYATQQATK